MKILVESTSGKICCKNIPKYFYQVIDALPTHKIIKIYGVNGDERLLIMKNNNGRNKWCYNDDLDFDKLECVVIKKVFKKPNLETIPE